jgi:hypothetical protein
LFRGQTRRRLVATNRPLHARGRGTVPYLCMPFTSRTSELHARIRGVMVHGPADLSQLTLPLGITLAPPATLLLRYDGWMDVRGGEVGTSNSNRWRSACARRNLGQGRRDSTYGSTARRGVCTCVQYSSSSGPACFVGGPGSESMSTAVSNRSIRSTVKSHAALHWATGAAAASVLGRQRPGPHSLGGGRMHGAMEAQAL